MMNGDKVYFGDRAVTLEVRSDGKLFIVWPVGGNDMTGATLARFEVSSDQISLTPPAQEETPVAEPEAQPEPVTEPEAQPEDVADEPAVAPAPDAE